MDENNEALEMHKIIKEMQNGFWAAYKEYINSGNMDQYNSNTNILFEKICNAPNKEMAKTLKAAADFFACGWAILVVGMKERMQ